VLNVIAMHKLALANAAAYPDLEHPAMRYACAGKSRTAIRDIALDLSTTVFMDHSTQRKAVEGRVISALLGACSEAYSESLMHAKLEPGEEIIWQASASAEVRAACLAFPSYVSVDGLIDIGAGIKIRVFTSTDIELGEKILVTPHVVGGENERVLGFGVMADVGAGFYEYQGGDGGSHTNATAIVDRALMIPTNPTAVVLTVANRATNAYGGVSALQP
jgi:hypothetical protein